MSAGIIILDATPEYTTMATGIKIRCNFCEDSFEGLSYQAIHNWRTGHNLTCEVRKANRGNDDPTF